MGRACYPGGLVRYSPRTMRPNPTAQRPVNAFTVDVEDYFHVAALSSVISRDNWATREYRVEANTERLLCSPSTRCTGPSSCSGGWPSAPRIWCDASRKPVTRSPVTASRTNWYTGNPRRSLARRPRAPRSASKTSSGRRARLPGGELLGDACLAVGARCADRSRLPFTTRPSSPSVTIATDCRARRRNPIA